MLFIHRPSRPSSWIWLTLAALPLVGIYQCPDIDPDDVDDDGDGWTEYDGDCDDANSEAYPGATEVCNDFDDNCVNGFDEIWDCGTWDEAHWGE